MKKFFLASFGKSAAESRLLKVSSWTDRPRWFWVCYKILMKDVSSQLGIASTQGVAVLPRCKKMARHLISNAKHFIIYLINWMIQDGLRHLNWLLHLMSLTPSCTPSAKTLTNSPSKLQHQPRFLLPPVTHLLHWWGKGNTSKHYTHH